MKRTQTGLIGWRIVRSIFLPRVIAVLMMLAGLAYAMQLYTPLLKPPQPYNLVSGASGELSLMIWLLALGVNSARWNKQAADQSALIVLQQH